MKLMGQSRPHLIIMVGIPGSGKSFFAEHFAETFKAPIVSCETFRKDLFNPVTFSKTEDDIINRITNRILEQVLKTERTVIYDGNTDTQLERDAVVKKARSFGYDPLYIWVQTEPATAKSRATSTKRAKAVFDEEMFESRLNRFQPLRLSEKPIVISGKHTYSSQLKIVLKYLALPRDKTSQST